MLPDLLTRTHAFIGALVLLVAALMLCFDGTRDGDLYLQMLGGRLIAQHGFTNVDPFPTIAQGSSWLNQQWLTELTIYQVARLIGVTGLTIAYAGLLAVPLALLLWICRRKGPAMMVALAALYCPGLWVIIHPRAAGFTLLAFSVVVGIVALTWLAPMSTPGASRRFRFGIPAILFVFALWANLHGGFIAGLLLIGVVTAGLALDRVRGLSEAVGAHRLFVLSLTGALAAITVTIATPLGAEIWAYILSFRNPAIAFVSSEWEPALGSPLAMAYLAIAAGFAAWLWSRVSAPRPLGPLLVTAGFLIFAVLALRNLVFIGPALALQIAVSAPDREVAVPRPLVGLAVAAAASPRWSGSQRSAQRATNSLWARHSSITPPSIPPAKGTSPATRASAPTCCGALRGHRSSSTGGWNTSQRRSFAGPTPCSTGGGPIPPGSVSRLHIGAVIADRSVAIRALLNHGFVAKLTTPDGAYLIRRSPALKPRALGSA